MGPYLYTIPDDRGREIKKLVRERNEYDAGGPPTKPLRADTKSLLTPGGDEQKMEEPPKPENDLDKYDRERLLKGLKYINGQAKRKITPRTQQFLKLHKDAYEANYGDYLGHELQEIRRDLKAAPTGAGPEVAKAALEPGPPMLWTTIADELAGANMGDLRKHVYVASGVLGIDPNHMVWLIKEWAERNSTFHNRIRQYIADCHWHSLAEQLCRDLKELLNVAPDEDTAAKYEKVLLNVLSRDDPQFWLPNEKSQKLTEMKVASEKNRAQ